MDRNGWSGSQLARELAIDQSSVVQALALLELPEPVQDLVEQGDLPPSTAYEVSQARRPRRTSGEVAGRIVAEDLSRAEAIEAVQEAAGRSAEGRKAKGRGAKAGPPKPKVFRTAGAKVTVELKRPGDVAAIRAALAEALGQLGDAGQGRGEAA